MNIHEYQAKAVLKEFGVPVSRGVPVLKVEDAEAAAKELGGPLWVVKSQIHAGGRGKGKFKEAAAGEKGGVRLAKSIDEVKTFVKRNARQHAGHHPDRPRRQAGQPPLYRGRLRHREGILPLGCWSIARPRASPSSSRPKAAWTSRKSPIDARKDPYVLGRSGHRHHAASRPHASPRRSDLTGDLAKQAGSAGRQALQGLRRQGHGHAGDQSAGRHQARAS